MNTDSIPAVKVVVLWDEYWKALKAFMPKNWHGMQQSQRMDAYFKIAPLVTIRVDDPEFAMFSAFDTIKDALLHANMRNNILAFLEPDLEMFKKLQTDLSVVESAKIEAWDVLTNLKLKSPTQPDTIPEDGEAFSLIKEHAYPAEACVEDLEKTYECMQEAFRQVQDTNQQSLMLQETHNRMSILQETDVKSKNLQKTEEQPLSHADQENRLQSHKIIIDGISDLLNKLYFNIKQQETEAQREEYCNFLNTISHYMKTIMQCDSVNFLINIKAEKPDSTLGKHFICRTNEYLSCLRYSLVEFNDLSDEYMETMDAIHKKLPNVISILHEIEKKHYGEQMTMTMVKRLEKIKKALEDAIEEKTSEIQNSPTEKEANETEKCLKKLNLAIQNVKHALGLAKCSSNIASDLANKQSKNLSLDPYTVVSLARRAEILVSKEIQGLIEPIEEIPWSYSEETICDRISKELRKMCIDTQVFSYMLASPVEINEWRGALLNNVYSMLSIKQLEKDFKLYLIRIAPAMSLFENTSVVREAADYMQNALRIQGKNNCEMEFIKSFRPRNNTLYNTQTGMNRPPRLCGSLDMITPKSRVGFCRVDIFSPSDDDVKGKCEWVRKTIVVLACVIFIAFLTFLAVSLHISESRKGQSSSIRSK
ncbi:uncharacterized protein NEMAJ01_1762 [Nematocida major]|uniref:uncharacterized protein n=1 Tax=Nematocida major TaxID=1912982 RepID=UPI002007B31A|nr:uncharacterized protein NEMAJ01_1762 [Nematocida major]KAH9386866.1 hypothetical protein NEMAJ01_1762 [Nematocida major]